MENGFDPLLVSEGHVTIGPNAISVAQDEGGWADRTPVTAHFARRFVDSRTVNYRTVQYVLVRVA
jgi:hypothetical protein